MFNNGENKKIMKNLIKIFMTLSTIFTIWLYYFTIKIGLWSQLWNLRPDVLIFIVLIGLIGLVVGFIDERKTYKRLNKLNKYGTLKNE